MTDIVARTRRQITADILRTTLELEDAHLRRDADLIAELQAERERDRDRLDSLDACFS